MVDLGLHRLRRSRPGRALAAGLSRLGLARTSMVVYARPLGSTDEEAAQFDDVPSAVDEMPLDATRSGETPPDVTLDVVRASELSIRPSPEFEDLAPSDFVVLARDASAPESVHGWVFVTLERPVSVTELSTTVRFDGAYLWGLFVAPSERERGVATVLLSRAVAFAGSDRVEAAYALVAAENAPSRRAFETVGFEAVDEVSYQRAFVWERRRGSLHADREYST
ncbi:GNAT family N-acetyltransferase [Halorubellus sp. JP-L1]|uniref:GNAT family N-acetyltransferase n=1 Tax=Halorubellus sp. JP-L1 TaxID=2715753 RepID=UPI0014077760|nr:GNAT family N-acetyltransferase [Halorubellus sp. JP-L1]NHN40299.1 GNAT family N-acetyltransferase [Halorubellus sp. JP-L1]